MAINRWLFSSRDHIQIVQISIATKRTGSAHSMIWFILVPYLFAYYFSPEYTPISSDGC